jgi:hypothetical protein
MGSFAAEHRFGLVADIGIGWRQRRKQLRETKQDQL